MLSRSPQHERHPIGPYQAADQRIQAGASSLPLIGGHRLQICVVTDPQDFIENGGRHRFTIRAAEIDLTDGPQLIVGVEV